MPFSRSLLEKLKALITNYDAKMGLPIKVNLAIGQEKVFA
jgi:hypothetical protein